MRTEQRGYGEDGRERRLVVPETTDDLWHLSHVLEHGDLVEGDTTRRIQRDDDNLRDKGGEREHMHVTIEVSDVEFARFANRLRVGGEIVDASREDQLGHHHTLNVEAHDELTI
ncbi:MAG: mRNA surveillance protein Pelota, partial [Halobaculum sp.]